MITIQAENIRSSKVVAMPSVLVTGQEFEKANIAWVKMEEGGQYEIVFDRFGEPANDPGLIRRLGFFYRKNFKQILFDGKSAYAAFYNY